jgi:hypothetical protein
LTIERIQELSTRVLTQEITPRRNPVAIRVTILKLSSELTTRETWTIRQHTYTTETLTLTGTLPTTRDTQLPISAARQSTLHKSRDLHSLSEKLTMDNCHQTPPQRNIRLLHWEAYKIAEGWVPKKIHSLSNIQPSSAVMRLPTPMAVQQRAILLKVLAAVRAP